ncbi:MAG: hypothetical protein ABSC23_01375 [Bryobacteraceae bacterium]|jgi:hypothetical protein
MAYSRFSSDFLKTLSRKADESQPATVAGTTKPNQSTKISEVLVWTEVFAGGWPPELSRGALDRINLDKLKTRLVDYITRSYRGVPANDPLRASKPEYTLVGKQVGRVANLFQDIKLIQAATLLRGTKVNVPFPNAEYLGLAFKVIQHYAETPLAKFLFLLPTGVNACEAIAQRKKGIVLEEQLRIDVYKGVENVLFEIWGELPEGGHFDDATVVRKLLSIVEASRS